MSTLDRRCDDVLDTMTAYLDDQMPSDERIRLETHMVYCPGCAGFIAQLRATVDMLKELPIEPVSAAERNRLLGAFWAAASNLASP